MTVRDMIVDMWVNGGEPNDLDPFQVDAPSQDSQYLDPNSYGVRYYMRELSQAQILLASWKTRRGRPIRFDKFMTQRNVKLGVEDNTVDCEIVDEYTIRINTPPTWMTPDKLESSRCTLVQDAGLDTETSETQVAMIVDYDLTGNIEIQFRDSITAITSPTISPQVTLDFDRFFIDRTGVRGDGSAIAMPVTMTNVLRIVTADDGAKLDRVEDKEDLYNAQLTSGTPSQWYHLGDRVFMDVYIEEPIWLTFEYQRLPIDITNIDQEPEIPFKWHQVLLTLNEWQTAKRLQDFDKESILFSHLNNLIERIRLDNEEEFLREETGNVYVRKEAR